MFKKFRIYIEAFLILLIISSPFIYILLKNNHKEINAIKQEYLSNEINLSVDPIQITYRDDKSLSYYDPYGYWKKQDAELFPIAKYKISGVVIAKKLTSKGWAANFGLAWKEAAEPQYLNFIRFHSDGVSLSSQYSKKFRSLSHDEQRKLARHFKKIKLWEKTSHNHIFSANEAIFNTLANLQQGQKVMLKGYLIRVTALNPYTNERYISAESSLRRDDTEIGFLDIRKDSKGKLYLSKYSMSCEVMYVEKVIVEN